MSTITSVINERAGHIARTFRSFTTKGIVTGSDEINNRCNVIYRDENGKIRSRDNVVVRLYDNGTGYFPKVGEKVSIQLENDVCVIVARHVGNYQEITAKMELKQDTMSDSYGDTIGGYAD